MIAVAELREIGKSFAGVRVVDQISFDIRAGEVHALLGENGAGKSTLIKILAGLHAPDAGEIRLQGKTVRFASPREAQAAGIATIYQELLLFPELSVAENIAIGHAPRRRWGGLDWPRMRAQAKELLASLDSHEFDVDAPVGLLSVANRQRVEIAKALSRNPQILVMDEPTAALAEADVERLLQIVRRLRERGVAILYVSHRMPEIFALADRVTVLRDGAKVSTQPIGDVTHASLVSMMVGRPIGQQFPPRATSPGERRLELRGLGYGTRVNDVSLSVHAGEIVGIAGLVGAGRTELAQTIFGITPATRGQILRDGKPVTITAPGQARNLGIGYVPEDRGLQGLIKRMSIRTNISLAVITRIARRLFIDTVQETVVANQAIERMRIRTQGAEQRAEQLSGGNQQKVVLAKWLATQPQVLILDEPTRGIDVGAKAEIYQLMTELAQLGMAILMISSELPEVLGMSDRVLVMNGGRIVAAFERADATPERVGAAMTLRHAETAPAPIASGAAGTIG